MARSDPAASRDPASVQREIEAAQQRLEWAVDQIADRANPTRIARRRLSRFRETGETLWGEARTLLSGDRLVRGESHSVEPPEGSVVRRGDEQVVSTYSTRALSTRTVLIGLGVGAAVTAGAVLLARRRGTLGTPPAGRGRRNGRR